MAWLKFHPVDEDLSLGTLDCHALSKPLHRLGFVVSHPCAIELRKDGALGSDRVPLAGARVDGLASKDGLDQSR